MKKGTYKVCKNCGKRYYMPPCRDYRLYCSANCYFNIHKAKVLICQFCGKSYKYHVDSSGKTYCSRRCANLSPIRRKHMSEAKEGCVAWNRGLKSKLSGEKHWNWQGGISPKEHSERLRFRRTIQKLVFERDNYTCQICGARGGDLQVDHIQSWKDYVELRFDINNCRTLCAGCHYKITWGKPMPSNLKGWGHNLLERERIQP